MMISWTLLKLQAFALLLLLKTQSVEGNDKSETEENIFKYKTFKVPLKLNYKIKPATQLKLGKVLNRHLTKEYIQLSSI